MNTVLSIIILIKQNTLKLDNNYIIASYILKNIYQIENKTIQEVAQECYVSTTTVLRFCELVGFSTYRKFKNMLVSTMKNRDIQLKEKNKNINPDTLLEHISYFGDSSFDLDEFKTSLNYIIDEITTYRVIHLHGATYPLALAQSFIEDMAILGVTVHVHQLNFSTSKLVEDDEGVHIIISYSGRFIEVNRNYYREIASLKEPTALISKMRDSLDKIDSILYLPNTLSNHYEDIILMLIYDYILVKYHSIVNNK